MSGTDPVRDRVVAAVRNAVAAAGLDLEDVVVRAAGRRRLVRVVVDRDGGVDLDVVAAVSGPVGDALEASGALGQTPYVLEVSSPGVDRPLRTPDHWRRARGRLVEVELADGTRVTGRVGTTDDTGAELDLGRRGRRIDYAAVSRAVVQVEFGPSGATAADDAGTDRAAGDAGTDSTAGDAGTDSTAGDAGTDSTAGDADADPAAGDPAAARAARAARADSAAHDTAGEG